jgi:hypothetical protein
MIAGQTVVAGQTAIAGQAIGMMIRETLEFQTLAAI